MSAAYLDTTGASMSAVAQVVHDVAIRDARGIRGELSLDREGFMLVDHRAETRFDERFLAVNATRQDDDQPLNRGYAAEVRRVVEALTGADVVIPQTRRIVVRATARAGRTTPDPVASLVHLDYSEGLARQVVSDSLRAAGIAPPPHRRMAICQTWRMLSPPPQDNALAICDAQTVLLEDSVILRAISSGGEDKQVRLCRYNPAHAWYRFSDMRPDEMLVFKGFDTQSPGSMTGAHVAYDMPVTAGTNPRISVEARFIAFYA